MKTIIFLLSIISCLATSSQSLTEGKWNGWFEYTDIRPPFTFEVKNTNNTPPTIIIINGDERITIRNSSIQGDSIFIPLNPFDATLRAKISKEEIVGIWKKGYRAGFVKFVANYGGMRFSTNSTSYPKIERKWAMEFKPGTADKYPAVGLFEQDDNKVKGTILTEVGDFRYFEGILDGDSLKMSSFDGVHAFMMTGVKTETGWRGKFYFEKNYSEEWTATYDPEAAIVDPFEMVTIDEKKHKPYFDLLGAGSGKQAIDAASYEGKVVIVQVLGTWCPNSYDQTRFLVDWYKTKSDQVEIVAATYEPNYSQEYGLRRIADYTAELEIPYDMVLGGRMNKTQPAFSFPFIDRINAFPTLIILDKNGFARYVHSYFNGPATGEYYQAFEEKLNELIKELLAE